MKFVSTNKPQTEIDLAEAVSGCIAPDGGLLLPASIPRLPRAFFNNISELTLGEIAYVIATSFFGDDITPQSLKQISDAAFAYGIPLVELEDDAGGRRPLVLELFHGPTLTVKDFGARFMAGLIAELQGMQARKPGRQDDSDRKILLSSSGNSAVAVGAAFGSLRGGEIYVVCPHGSVRRRRHSILSALGPHVHLIEVAGGIDICNSLVRTFIADERAFGNKSVCGANSVNIARLIPEIVFYFQAYARMREKFGEEIADRTAYAIPCGNLTALCAAVIARRMGLPIGKIIAAASSTDALGSFMRDEIVAHENVVHSKFAKAMNSDCPTNLPRLVSLCGGREGLLREIEYTVVDDTLLSETIAKVRSEAGYSLNPHSAIAYAAAEQEALSGNPVVALATAHAAVDIDAFTAITGAPVELPHQLTRLMNSNGLSPLTRIAPTVPALRKFVREEKARLITNP